MASPIADLSYRHYDGILEPPLYRWWPIAKMSMRLAIKKKGFWIWSSLSGFFYVVMIAVFYFASLTPQGAQALFPHIVWKNLFLNAFSYSQLLLFIVALLIGLGSIANDNRSNALLVYLSKPCTKLDYIVGKWVGIFLPISIVSAVPSLLFYGYCALSYKVYGFFDDPLLLVRLVGVALIPGVFHASLALAVSSMFNQGRLAGATYAGVYFFTYFFTFLMKGIVMTTMGGSGGVPPFVSTLFYASIDGMQIGLAKVLLHTDGGAAFPGMGDVAVPAPNGYVFFPIFVGVCALSCAIAWTRVRAVEVVG